MAALTEIQINARIKAMGVGVILKQLARDDRRRRAEADTRWNLDHSLLERIRDERSRLAFMDRDRDEFGFVDEAEYGAIKDKIGELENERSEIRQNTKPPSWPDLADVHDFIATQRATTKWQPCIPEIKIPKGVTAGDELARIRAEEVDPIRAAIRGAEIAWLPEEDAVRKAIAEIDKLVISGAPDVKGVFRLSKPNPAVRAQQGSIEWQKEYIGSDYRNAGFAFVVWLHRDALVERVKKEIAALARPNALSVADREEKIAALKVRLLEAERREEATFLLAVKSDPSLQRRPVDMKAFLQIEEAPPEASAEATEFG